MLSLADPDAAVAEVDSLHRARRAHRAHPPRAGARRATARSRSLGDKLHDPVWARLAEASIPVAFHLGDSGYNGVRRRRGAARDDVRAFGKQRPRSARCSSSDRAIHDTIASLDRRTACSSGTRRCASPASRTAPTGCTLLVKRLRSRPTRRRGCSPRTRSTRSAQHVWVTPYYEEDLRALADLDRRRAHPVRLRLAARRRARRAARLRRRSSTASTTTTVQRIMRDNCLELLGTERDR